MLSHDCARAQRGTLILRWAPLSVAQAATRVKTVGAPTSPRQVFDDRIRVRQQAVCRWCPRRRRLQPNDSVAYDDGPRRLLGLWQNDAAPHDQPDGRSVVWDDLDRWRGRLHPQPGRTPPQHRVCDAKRGTVAAPQGAREHRNRVTAQWSREG